MRLIVNTNRIIAALIKNSASRKLITSGKFELLSVKLAKSELEAHKKEILKKSRLMEEDFNKLSSRLLNKIYFADDLIIDLSLKKAVQIMKNIDIEDSPFIALALSVSNDGIWSDDKHFLKQKEIKVFRTKDLATHIT